MADMANKLGTSPLEIAQRWYTTSDPALLSEHIMWQVLDSFPSGGLYRGRAEVLDRFFPAVQSFFKSYHATPELFAVTGDVVMATGVYSIESLSGQHAKIAFAHVLTVYEETIFSFQQIADTAAINAMLP